MGTLRSPDPTSDKSMSDVNANLRYLKSHEWARLESDGTVTVGISEHAQEALGELVFVELPEVGATFAQKDTAGVVESVKAAADVYMPVSGEVTEVNEALRSDPSLANSDPLGAGWFFKVKLQPLNSDPLAGLMDAKAYAAVIG